MRQCVRLCVKLELIAGNVLFLDGSKIRANAAIKNSWTAEKGEKALRKVEQRIEALLVEVEALDQEEEGTPSLVAVSEQLGDARGVKERVKGIMAELRESGKKALNTVDRECLRVNGVHGSHAGYNAQIAVDDLHGLLVSCDVATTNNDLGQFSLQVEQAQHVLGRPCQTAVADAGYADTEDLAKVVQQGIQVLVPSQRVASGRKIGAFDKRRFRYDAAGDHYLRPEGKPLRYSGLTRKRKGKVYQIAHKADCLGCAHFGRCTTSRNGRKVMRLNREEQRQRLEQEYALPENQAIYKRRQEKAELPFGHFKRNLGVSGFLLRGREGARAELALLSLCFNLRRMLTLLRAKGMRAQLKDFVSGKLPGTSAPGPQVTRTPQPLVSLLTQAS